MRKGFDRGCLHTKGQGLFLFDMAKPATTSKLACESVVHGEWLGYPWRPPFYGVSPPKLPSNPQNWRQNCVLFRRHSIGKGYSNVYIWRKRSVAANCEFWLLGGGGCVIIKINLKFY